ncbi:hypothetical protein [Reyranella sp.]|uniref:hypothetical protein n=1 Tax=Reyranella sp. TaxID=1929291 RepID=UPI003D0ABA73
MTPLDLTFQALADPTRRIMVERLARSQKVGRVRTCRIEPTALQGAKRWIVERRAAWEHCLDRLGSALEKGTLQASPVLPDRELPARS